MGRSVEVQASLGWAPGTKLLDALGGPGAVVGEDGKVAVTVPPSGAVVLHP